MAATTKESQSDAKQRRVSGALQNIGKETRPLQAFFTKFGNDGVMNFSAALAYNLLMAIFPIAIAILAILGLVLGSLSPSAYSDLKTQIIHVLPVSSGGVVDSVTKQLARASGILSIIAIVLALFNGSRLFILIEYCFGIIYHVRQRPVIKQNLMAIGMLLLFIILIPIMTLASAAPAIVLSILPGGGILASLGGILGGLIASYLLFQAIYLVVPNQSISFRNSWIGSVVAAVALQIYLTLFPFYVQHFLSAGYAASIGSAIFLLIFFYYFAVILLIGAEVNAFFGEGVKATPVDLVTMVHITTSHLPKTEEHKDQQAPPSHREAPIGNVAANTHIDDTLTDAKASASVTTLPASSNPAHEEHETKTEEHKTKKEPAKTTSKTAVVAEAVAGTGLAFLVEWFRLRRK